MLKKRHPHILLAESHMSSVSYCESCRIVEIEIGATSLRVEENVLTLLRDLLRDAEKCLNIHRNRKEFLESALTDMQMH